MRTKGSYSFQDLESEQPGSQIVNGGRQVLRGVSEYSRKLTRLLSNEIKTQSRSIAAEQITLASTKLDTLAEALRESAGKLREKQSYSLAKISEAGSQNIMNLANFFREGNPDRLVGKVEEFARNRPGMFLGVAVFAGVLLGQLFSSPGRRLGTFEQGQIMKQSSIEYKPGKDEEGYYERH